jgi:cysteine desulfurase
MSLYFNNAFSKRPLDEVVHTMSPFMAHQFENPLTESEGSERVRDALQIARAQVAGLINAMPEEIYFVSSGTEANNWALKGLAHAWSGKKDHIIISAVEHFSIYQTAQFLNRHGIKTSIVPVDRDGRVDPESIAKEIQAQTFLVSMQCASDEIGVIQEHQEVAKLKSQFPDVIFHTDAIQFLCYEELDVKRQAFDLVSISSNALYGPPGVAALFIKEGTRIVPLIHGGMQEDGLRAGLQPIANIVGFGKAAAIAKYSHASWKVQLSGIQKSMFQKIKELEIPITGSVKYRTVDNIHFLADVDGEALLSLLLEDGISASTGSTCYQFAQKESHVLKALGITNDQARGAILFTTGIDVTESDVNLAIASLERNLKHLRSLKPM